MFHGLGHLIQREDVAIGLFVTPPADQTMRAEAVNAGFYEWKGQRFPRVRILTVEAFLNGARSELPLIDDAAMTPSPGWREEGTAGVTTMKLLKAAVVLLSLGAAGCDSAGQPPSPEEQAQAEQAAREAESNALKIETEAAIREVVTDPTSVLTRRLSRVERNGQSAICGEVNSKNTFGGYTGFRPFVVVRRGAGASEVEVTILNQAQTSGLASGITPSPIPFQTFCEGPEQRERRLAVQRENARLQKQASDEAAEREATKRLAREEQRLRQQAARARTEAALDQVDEAFREVERVRNPPR